MNLENVLRPPVLVVATISVLLVIATTSWVRAKHRAGICIPEMRRVPVEERTLNAVHYLLRQPTYAVLISPNANGGAHLVPPKHVIQYESAEQFLKENPDCCIFNGPTDSPLSDYETEWKGIGFQLNMFYNVRYLDFDGRVRIIPTHRGYNMTNCGEIVELYRGR